MCDKSTLESIASFAIKWAKTIGWLGANKKKAPPTPPFFFYAIFFLRHFFSFFIFSMIKTGVGFCSAKGSRNYFFKKNIFLWSAKTENNYFTASGGLSIRQRIKSYRLEALFGSLECDKFKLHPNALFLSMNHVSVNNVISRGENPKV